MAVWDTDVSGTVSPTAQQTCGCRESDAVGVLLAATPSAPISAVGSMTAGPSTYVFPTSLSVSPEQVGDLMVLVGLARAAITSVSGGGVSTWHAGPSISNGTYTHTELSLWWGVVSSTGQSTVSLGYGNYNPTYYAEVDAQEYSAGSAGTWSFDSGGTSESGGSTTTFPSLSPSATNGELYFGFAGTAGLPQAGGSAGFDYQVTPGYDIIASDTDVTTTQAPTSTQGGSGSDAIAALFSTTSTNSGQTAAFGYDQDDQMVSATVGPNSASYSYNGDGLLVGRTSAGVTTTNFWDATSGLPLLLSDGTYDYLYGTDDTPVEEASIASGTPAYFVSDDQGSTRALLSPAGGVGATFNYDPYGNLTSSSGNLTTPLLYDGQYEDSVTGFYYLRARWYDAVTAEFLGVDPDVAFTGQPYVFAGDDPINNRDPAGDMSIGVCAGFAITFAFIQFGAGSCLTRIMTGPNAGSMGLVTSPLGGIGFGLEAGVSWYLEISNADSISDLKALFTYVSVSAAFGEGATAAFFWDSNPTSNPFIFGGDIGVNGAEGASGVIGELYSFISGPPGGTKAARFVWNLLAPNGVSAQATEELNKAAAVKKKYDQPEGPPYYGPQPPIGPPYYGSDSVPGGLGAGVVGQPC